MKGFIRLTGAAVRFYVDHDERALPTPHDHSVARSYVLLHPEDPDLPELLDDARHYAHPHGPDGAPHISSAAKALLRQYASQTQEHKS